VMGLSHGLNLYFDWPNAEHVGSWLLEVAGCVHTSDLRLPGFKFRILQQSYYGLNAKSRLI
jgi:hypothetical protein